MARRLNFNEAKSLVEEKYGDSLVIIDYNGMDKKSKFICSKHGEVERTLRLVLVGKYACRDCYKLDAPRIARKDISTYLSEVKKRHPSFDFSKFNPLGMTDKSTVTCPRHGDHKIDLHHIYYRNQLCDKCGNDKISQKRKTTKDKFIKKFEEKNGYVPGLYDIDFKGWREKITLKCFKHGTYERLAYALYLSGGCPECGRQHVKKYLTKTRFIKSCRKNFGVGFFYVFSVSYRDEHFYKIGVTSSIKRRTQDFNGKSYSKYTFTLCHLETGTPEHIFQKEVNSKKILKEYRYLPKHRFGGFTECFFNIEKIIDYDTWG